MLCANFGWNWPSGSGEEGENMKSLRQRRRQRQQRRRRRTTDKFWSEKLTWAFGSGELKTNCAEYANIYICACISLNKKSAFVITFAAWILC